MGLRKGLIWIDRFCTKDVKMIGTESNTILLPSTKRMEMGRALREKVPRQAHGDFQLSATGRDGISILEESNQGRMANLVPIRYGRMLADPFAFLRGSAALMAYDLAATPVSGIRVQACGDCHLANLGLFATPERNLVFDLNDFDETLPAPWEWDIKRLAASFVVSGRVQGISDIPTRLQFMNWCSPIARTCASMRACMCWMCGIPVLTTRP